MKPVIRKVRGIHKSPKIVTRSSKNKNPPSKQKNRQSCLNTVTLSPSLRILSEQLVDGTEAAFGGMSSFRQDPQDLPLSRFKIFVYREVRLLIQKGHEKSLKTLVEYQNSRPRSISFDRNPFHWALFVILKSNEFSNLTANSINNIGWQLLHAHNHHVNPELLIGFIYQTAASGRAKQAKIKRMGTSYRESWLDEYQREVAPCLPERLKPK